jgi:hypothetical protein
MKTQTLIKRAQACFDREEALDKKLKIAEYLERPTKRIKSAIVTNWAAEAGYLEELARREHGGEVIDYGRFSSVSDMVGGTLAEMKFQGELK